MSLLRLVTVWLFMAVLPLQGMAAASMLFCGQAGHAVASAHGGHDHAAHGGGPAHGHGHDEAGDDGDEARHADAPSPGAADNPDAAAGAHDGHKCPACASCGHLVALSATPLLTLVAAPPAAPPLARAVRVLTRDEPTPDKPPRA